MRRRRPNPQRAKIHRSYDVEETARLFDVHKNTVRNWVRNGLRPIDDHRPIVIRGDELRRFLSERRQKAKQRCGPGRLYCVACREPKVPAGDMVEFVKKTETTGALRGICPDCNRLIYRRVNPAKVSIVCGNLDVTATKA